MDKNVPLLRNINTQLIGALYVRCIDNEKRVNCLYLIYMRGVRDDGDVTMQLMAIPNQDFTVFFISGRHFVKFNNICFEEDKLCFIVIFNVYIIKRQAFVHSKKKLKDISSNGSKN